MFAIVLSIVGLALTGLSAWFVRRTELRLAQRVEPSWLPSLWCLLVLLAVIAGPWLGSSRR